MILSKRTNANTNDKQQAERDPKTNAIHGEMIAIQSKDFPFI